MTFRLSPSDFAFLYSECPRCFYLKLHNLLHRPRTPFPPVFNTIDLAMKRHFRGLRTTDVLPDMKPGVFLCEDQDAWVESQIISPTDSKSSLFIRGMIDGLVRFDDGTYGVIDFKTSSSAKPAFYTRQLHAYAMALESPSNNSQLKKLTISQLALIVYSPSQFHTPQKNDRQFAAALTGDLKYVPVKRDDHEFNRFLQSVLKLLDREHPPPPPPPGRWGGKFSCCPFCQYLHDAQKAALINF